MCASWKSSPIDGMVDESSGGVMIQMAMGECSTYRQTRTSSLQLDLRVGSHLVLTDFHLDVVSVKRQS